MKCWQWMGLAVFVVAVVGGSGCASSDDGAAPTGYSTSRFLEGDLEVIEYHPLAKVEAAVRATIKELGFKIGEEQKWRGRLTLITRDPLEQTVVFKLEQRPDGTTWLSVRVTLLGDEKASRRIYRKVLGYLQ